MVQVSTMQGEVWDQESRRLGRSGGFFPHQETPRITAVAVGKAETVRQVGELFKPDLFQVASGVDAVANVLSPKPPIEAGNATRIVQFNEVVRHALRGSDREHGSRRCRGRNLDRLTSPESVEFIQMIDSGARPGLRMNEETHFFGLKVEAPQARLRIGLENRDLRFRREHADEL